MLLAIKKLIIPPIIKILDGKTKKPLVSQIINDDGKCGNIAAIHFVRPALLIISEML